MTRILPILIVSLFSCFHHVVAQIDLPEVIRFKNYDNNSGLPGETVRTLYQDRSGLIWLGVEYKGLIAFDGNEFDLFSFDERDSSSLSSNVVECISEDHDGNLWVGTDNGLNRKTKAIHDFSLSGFTRFFHSEDSSSLPGNSITCLFLNKKNELMIGTENGLAIYEGNDRFKRISLNESAEPAVLAIFYLNGGNFLIGTDQGMFLLSYNYEIVKPWLKEELIAREIKEVNSICKDNRDRLWIGCDRGLFVYMNGHVHMINEISNEPFRYIGIDKVLRDQDGRIWVGSISNGLYIFYEDGEKYSYHSSNHLTRSGFQAYQIRDILEDSQGLMWVGTKNKGLYMHDHRLLTFGYLGVNSGEIRLSENDVSAVYFDEDKKLYVGTRQGGLNIINTKTLEVTYFKDGGKYDGINANRIEAITADKEGYIWLGTIRGVSRFDPKREIFKHYDLDPVRALLFDSNDNFWVGTSSDVFILDPIKDSFVEFIHPELMQPLKYDISCLYESKNGEIYMGTLKSGLIKYFPREGRIVHYHKDQGSSQLHIPFNQVRSIYEDHYGHLWLGMRLGGLYKQEARDGAFKLASELLKNVSVFSILEGSPGDLWLASNRGIYNFNSQTGELVNYGTKYGVQGEVFTSSTFYKTKGGVIFFGGNNGLNYFEPHQTSKQFYKPDISFKNLESPIHSLERIAKGGVYYFKYGSNVSFEFFINDFSSPSKNTYEYKLSGGDDNWVKLGSRNYVSFVNMEPGDYSVSVRGANSDGIFSKSDAKIEFKILNPWWFSSMAKFIYVIAVLILLYVVYRALIFRTQKKHELSVMQLEKDQSEELSRHKIRFFTNISHELKTPLTVMLPSAEEVSKYQGDNQISNKGKTLLRNIKVLTTLIDELLDFRKIEQGHTTLNPHKSRVLTLCQSIFEEFVPLANQREIEYRLAVDDADFSALVDVKVLSKILRNLLSNAFKYSDKRDEITLQVKLTDERSGATGQKLVMTVKDTGSGIPKEALPYIFDRFYRNEKEATLAKKGTGIGLDLVNSLVKLHGGTVHVESVEGEGSSFTVSIPIEVLEKYDFVVKPQEEVRVVSNAGTSTISTQKPKTKLLVVEDDHEIRELLIEVFSGQYDVIVAENGKKGLELANELPQPNLIISDIMMPEMDGIELCKAIRANNQTSHIPVVLLTAKSTMADQLMGIDVGADDYVTKPFYTNVLVAKVNNIIGRQERLKTYFEKEVTIQPEDPPAYTKEKELLDKCRLLIEQNIDNQNFGVEELAHEVGISRAHLFRKLKYHIDMSPLEFIFSIRLKKAVDLLQSQNYSASEVAYMTGFSSPSSFSTTFKKYKGITPKECMNQHAKK